jgi:hypothetical protein
VRLYLCYSSFLASHDAIELQNLQRWVYIYTSKASPNTYSLAHIHKVHSPAPPPPPTPRLKPYHHPSDHDHTPLHRTPRTITALKHAAEGNRQTSEILHHGAKKFIEHCDQAPRHLHHDLHKNAAAYRTAADEHHAAAGRLASEAQSLESASASGQVSKIKLQALHRYAKASAAKAQSNGNIAINGIYALEDAKLPNYLHRYERNRGEHFYADRYKKKSESRYNAAVCSFPELDATQSIRSP